MINFRRQWNSDRNTVIQKFWNASEQADVGNEEIDLR